MPTTDKLLNFRQCHRLHCAVSKPFRFDPIFQLYPFLTILILQPRWARCRNINRVRELAHQLLQRFKELLPLATRQFIYSINQHQRTPVIKLLSHPALGHFIDNIFSNWLHKIFNCWKALVYPISQSNKKWHSAIPVLEWSIKILTCCMNRQPMHQGCFSCSCATPNHQTTARTQHFLNVLRSLLQMLMTGEYLLFQWRLIRRFFYRFCNRKLDIGFT